MKAIFINTENSKSNETRKFVLKLSHILDLRSSNKHVALQNLSIYFELSDGCYSFSDIQDYIKYIIKNTKHKQQFLLFMFMLIESIIYQCLK